MTYGNHSIAPVNPGSQAITIYNFTFCSPEANVTLAKTSRIISDGVSGTNPKALPEAIVNYCILATNSGSGTVTNFIVPDDIPSTLQYIPGSIMSGPGCNSAKAIEDDDALGADESDPIGASISGNTITVNATTLSPNQLSRSLSMRL